ncbi:MAG: VCBS repeat-containing protein [Anaerolineae bacterium]|nr:VCBS repeat-containing protein [Anaerolineae bacterium]
MRHFVKLVLLLLLVGCAAAEESRPQPNDASLALLATAQPLPLPPFPDTTRLFFNVTEQAGLAAAPPHQGTEKLIGQAWGDYDRDGWLDLYITDSAGPNTLFHNNQDGTFSISEFSAMVSLSEAMSSGVLFADYNDDGWPDLYVLNWGANVLYRNDGGKGFTEVTAAAGVDDTGHGKSAAWGDVNNDGFLDLYVANWACYPLCGRPQAGDRDRLYLNNGDGTFTDISGSLSSKILGAGFAVSFIDYDNDGDLDIYLVNDEFINPVGNALWRNDGPGCNGWCFTDVSADSGSNTRVMGMGLAAADYNNNGFIDFFFSNAGPMALLQNLGDGTFTNVAAAAGVALSADVIGWGAVFFDYDNDGWLDLYLAVSDRAPGTPPRDAFLRNNGDGTFTELLDVGFDGGRSNLGVAYGDYDRDGWVDLVVGSYNQGYQLYRNLGGSSGHHRMVFDLVGGGPINRDAIGTRVTVTTPDGRTQMQEVHSGSSLGAGNALTLYFGLGRALQATVTVTWPDGLSQTFATIPANFHYTLVYPQ